MTPLSCKKTWLSAVFVDSRGNDFSSAGIPDNHLYPERNTTEHVDDVASRPKALFSTHRECYLRRQRKSWQRNSAARRMPTIRKKLSRTPCLRLYSDGQMIWRLLRSLVKLTQLRCRCRVPPFLLSHQFASTSVLSPLPSDAAPLKTSEDSRERCYRLA